jgi:hypothetical protein
VILGLIPWRSLPLANMVYEAIVERSGGGDRPIRVDDIVDWVLKRFDYRLSESELAKALLTLEVLGKVEVSRTGREVIVKLARQGA